MLSAISYLLVALWFFAHLHKELKPKKFSSRKRTTLKKRQQPSSNGGLSKLSAENERRRQQASAKKDSKPKSKSKKTSLRANPADIMLSDSDDSDNEDHTGKKNGGWDDTLIYQPKSAKEAELLELYKEDVAKKRKKGNLKGSCLSAGEGSGLWKAGLLRTEHLECMNSYRRRALLEWIGKMEQRKVDAVYNRQNAKLQLKKATYFRYIDSYLSQGPLVKNSPKLGRTPFPI